MKDDIVTIDGVTYEAAPMTEDFNLHPCMGCVADENRPLCNRLPDCEPRGRPLIWVKQQ